MKLKTATSLILMLTLVLSLSVCSPSPAAGAAVYTLRFDSVDPATSITATVLDGFKAEVEVKSGGRIKIEIFYGSTLGALADAYDNLLTGISDLMWGAAPHYPGRFPCTEGITMPFMGIESTKQATDVLWDLYTNNEDFQKEYSAVKVLAIHGSAGFVLASPSLSPAEQTNFSSLKIRTSSTGLTNWVTELGATPISLNAGEVYEAVNRKIVDMLMWDWAGLYNYRLFEQIKYIVNQDVNYTPFFVLMNQSAYNSLPDDLKAVIDECSGAALAQKAGEIWQDYAGDRKQALAEAGVELITLPDSTLSIWKDAGAKVSEKWINDMNALGFDGQAIYKAYLDTAAKYAE